jgi:argininosuccinate synthase
VRFEGGQARPVGRDSEYAVYSEAAASFNTSSVGDIEQADATGVAKYHGFQSRLANAAARASAPEAAPDGGTATGPDGTDGTDGE